MVPHFVVIFMRRTLGQNCNAQLTFLVLSLQIALHKMLLVV
jgi:hypothetical protein